MWMKKNYENLVFPKWPDSHWVTTNDQDQSSRELPFQ
jgi:hypothetical protein